MATCVCEPSNATLCTTACVCRPGPTALNGNKIISLSKSASGSSGKVETAAKLSVRISHIIGRFCCVILDSYLFGIVITPVLVLCWAFCVIETEIQLRRDFTVNGAITRRSGCCTWRTQVRNVTRMVSDDLGSDAESLPKMHLCCDAGPGAAKMDIEISEGLVPGLENAVNEWIASASTDDKNSAV